MFSKYYILTLQQVMYIVHTSKHAIKSPPLVFACFDYAWQTNTRETKKHLTTKYANLSGIL